MLLSGALLSSPHSSMPTRVIRAWGELPVRALTRDRCLSIVSALRTRVRMVDGMKLSRASDHVNTQSIHEQRRNLAVADEPSQPGVHVSARPAIEGVQVIHRAVDILWELRAHPEGRSIPAIARAVGLARPTVHRIVNTLEAVGFVLSLPGGQVRLGAALGILAEAANSELASELRPYLKALSSEINEGVILAVLNGDRMVCVDYISSPQSLQAVTATGAPVPVHCTAIGKALLPELSPEEFERLVPEELQERTPKTITTRKGLLKEIERIRSRGVAFDLEEYEIGLCGLGIALSPIPQGTLVSIGILAPAVRFWGNEERLASELEKTRDLIRARFGAN